MCQSRMSRVPPTPSFRQNGSEVEKKKEGKVGIRKILDTLDVETPGEKQLPESGGKTPALSAVSEYKPKTGKPSQTDWEKVRILKPDGYRTQISSRDNPNKFVDHLFNCGEIVDVQHWRAEDLIRRGIAEAVHA